MMGLISTIRKAFNLQWIVFGILIYSGGIAIYNFLFLKPRVSEYKELKMKKALMDETYVSRRSKKVEKIMSYLKEKVENLQEEEEELFTSAFRVSQFPLLINELEVNVKEAQLLIKSSDAQVKESEVKGYDMGIFQLEVVGSFAGLLDLLHRLGQSKSHFFLDDLRLELYNSNGSALTVKLRVLTPLRS